MLEKAFDRIAGLSVRYISSGWRRACGVVGGSLMGVTGVGQWIVMGACNAT